MKVIKIQKVVKEYFETINSIDKEKYQSDKKYRNKIRRKRLKLIMKLNELHNELGVEMPSIQTLKKLLFI